MDLTIDQVVQLIGRQAIAIESLNLQLKAGQAQNQTILRERDAALAESMRLRQHVLELEAELGKTENIKIRKQEIL